MTPDSAPRVCALVLAAGQSQRFGRDNKLLVEVGGVPILERVIRVVSQSGVGKILVVTGADHEAVASILSRYDVELVFNENWEKGMGGSLAKGVGHAAKDEFEGLMVCLGDLPAVDKSIFERVMDAFQENACQSIIVPVHQGRHGHPVMFPRHMFPLLEKLSGDQGARHLIRDHANGCRFIEVGSGGIFMDIDTLSDMEEIR